MHPCWSSCSPSFRALGFVAYAEQLSSCAAALAALDMAATTVAASDGVVAAELFVYDFGEHACGIPIRERNPRAGDGAGPGAAPKAFKEKATADFTGWTVWASSVLLSRWILEHRDVFAAQHVLELGSGCGLAGLVCSQQTAAAAVQLSDYQSETLHNLQYNIDLSCAPVFRGSDASVAASTHDVRWKHRSATAEMQVAAVDWDNEGTYPSTGADVVMVSDATYRRSYARKLACVVDALLKPGGLFVYSSPVAREGLPVLVATLARMGYADVTETPVPDSWKTNPLRATPAAARVEAPIETPPSASTPSWEGVADASRPPIRYVPDSEARCMFPELFMSSYDFVIVTARKPAAPPAVE